jgi:hypothetical protein
MKTPDVVLVNEGEGLPGVLALDFCRQKQCEMHQCLFPRKKGESNRLISGYRFLRETV